MRDKIERVDGILIDRMCQPVIDWVNGHLTVNCFKAARVLVDLSAFAWILSQASGLAAAAGAKTLENTLVQFALVVVGLSAIIVLRGVFDRAGTMASGGQGNPLRAAMYSHRLTCLLWLVALLIKTSATPLGLESLALLGVGGFATAAVYMGACSNRPPARREYRENNLSPRSI